MRIHPGTRLGPYEILEPLGAGGMGEVYRARHLKLGREVAIKVLPPDVADDPERLARFEREARTASALNHPHIVTIYDIAEHEGTTFIAMELVEGQTLRERLAGGPLPIDEAVALARHVAAGLARAHEAGIVHRDIKPANLMITRDGTVKILDFGLAKPLLAADGAAPSETSLATWTREGVIVGTPHYMSPEQLAGGAVDHRADQFSLGCVLYEMIGGRPPFEASSLTAVFGAILAEPPRSLRRLRAGTPRALDRIVARSLEKEPERRFPSMAALDDALLAFQRRQAGAARRAVAALRRPRVAAAAVVAVLGVAAGGWVWSLGADRRWAEREALAEITELIETGDLYSAYLTALEAEKHRPDDPELEEAIERITLPFVVNSDPPGAEIAVKEYGVVDAAWRPLGVTPANLRVPYQMMHWRIAREGYVPFEGAPFSPGSIGALAQGLVLDPVGRRPAGTVRIPGGPLERIGLIEPTRFLAGAIVEPYYLERFEVTNRQFKEFVDTGGYRTPEWWPDPMLREGVDVPWEEALDAFRDPTGRHGPATWELGDFPEGEDEYPVGGISWFEAAAYCAFAGRSLPSVFHWFRAIGQEQRSDILLYSNMDGEAKAPVGQFRGLSAYGAYDMAGNVKEWVWNGTGDLRYILGGSWNEPTYLFKHLVAQDPWGREAVNGVRCAEYPEPPSENLMGPITPLRDYVHTQPVGDEAFELLVELYAYDRDPLEARIEREDDGHPGYRRQTVSIRTAYGDDRMEIHLLIPRDASPPYQSVIWFPGDDVFMLRSSERFSSAWLFDFLPRAGRVLVYPVYRGMYERFEPWQRTPNDWRDMVISWAQDIGRTIDYLETRDDFDAAKIAYYGFSSGALYAPVFSVVEPRLAAIMFIGGGVIPRALHPAMEPAHFAPRTRTPTLMINGREDFLVPYEISQRPLFESLGVPDSLKRHARLEGGHIPSDTREVVREVLDWLDAHFGPVLPAGRVASAPGPGSGSGTTP